MKISLALSLFLFCSSMVLSQEVPQSVLANGSTAIRYGVSHNERLEKLKSDLALDSYLSTSGGSLGGDLVFLNDRSERFIRSSANGGAIRIRSNSVAAVDRGLQLGFVDNNSVYYKVAEIRSGENNLYVNDGYVFHSNNLSSLKSELGLGASAYASESLQSVLTRGNIAGTAMFIENSDRPVGSPTARALYIQQDPAGGGTIESYNYATSTGNHLFINPNGGNVGIGTLTPKESLSVNGKIRAKEIKVESDNWPDYVFSKDHKLSSLNELEAFIKDNSHLPEMPSAVEVAREGISVGEMNAKLLKKIEELTLHLIDQNKELRSLKQANEELNARVVAIEKEQ